jgi:hypothetical protein
MESIPPAELTDFEQVYEDICSGEYRRKWQRAKTLLIAARRSRGFERRIGLIRLYMPFIFIRACKK